MKKIFIRFGLIGLLIAGAFGISAVGTPRKEAGAKGPKASKPVAASAPASPEAKTSPDSKEEKELKEMRERMEPVRSSKDKPVDAVLLSTPQKLKMGEATVVAGNSGLEIIDPQKTDGKPKSGQGHFHYRVDDGPVIATTSAKLSFHELKPGAHVISVWLAGNDHQPLSAQKRLAVTVP